MEQFFYVKVHGYAAQCYILSFLLYNHLSELYYFSNIGIVRGQSAAQATAGALNRPLLSYRASVDSMSAAAISKAHDLQSNLLKNV